MILRKTADYHEDMGCCIFICFSRDKEGKILGEPPEISFLHGYLETDFDENKWTHFIHGDTNFIFSGADPVNFPPIGPGVNLSHTFTAYDTVGLSALQDTGIGTKTIAAVINKLKE